MKTLAIYLMCGPETPELAEAAVEGGADLVELGFPFSDPLADGPVDPPGRRARARAGDAHRRVPRVPRRDARALPETPLVPMTYSSLLEAYGWERFAADARGGGRDEHDRRRPPAGERPELRRVQLVAPTSTDERLALAAAQTDGWLYLVTLTGTTGARSELSPALAGLVERARAQTELPLYAGFGISTPEHARAAAELADGIVVGSRAVEVAEDGPGGAARLRRVAAGSARRMTTVLRGRAQRAALAVAERAGRRAGRASAGLGRPPRRASSCWCSTARRPRPVSATKRLDERTTVVGTGGESADDWLIREAPGYPGAVARDLGPRAPRGRGHVRRQASSAAASFLRGLDE